MRALAGEASNHLDSITVAIMGRLVGGPTLDILARNWATIDKGCHRRAPSMKGGSTIGLSAIDATDPADDE